MQSLVSRCQQQCTRRIPGSAIRVLSTSSPSASSSSSTPTPTPRSLMPPTHRNSTPITSPAAAAHYRFFSVCRRTMALNLNVDKVPYTPAPKHKKIRKPYVGQRPRQGSKSVVQDDAGGPRVGEGSSSSGGSGGRETQGGLAGQAVAGGGSKIGTRKASGPTPSIPRRVLPPIVAPTEMVIFWDTSLWLLRHGAHEFGYRLMPDGFVPITDMLRHESLAHVTPQEFIARIRRDPQDRFEMTLLPEYINGVAHERWWVRARSGHSIPGVSHKSKRILNSSKLTYVIYIGKMSDWETIRKRGLDIRAYNDSLIPLSQQKETDFLDGHIPSHTTVLCIRINADEAIRKGVMFFHDNQTRLVSTGNGDGIIPPSSFMGALELEISKEVLKR
ncbi:KptA family-domain-containing protein [Panaeolus papilionaceus]|nr:KptA family-domain-containing protein [Panaeolus papilionaceus]